MIVSLKEYKKAKFRAQYIKALLTFYQGTYTKSSGGVK